VIGFRVRTSQRGPLFNGAARRAARDFSHAWEDETAEEALEHIRGTFHRSFKNPTGFYESNVRISRSNAGPEITDGGMSGPVYGPWLEGVGSRNNTSRFKGYHAFRNAYRVVERKAHGIGERLLDRRYLRRMN
jgi:hypothetical protein